MVQLNELADIKLHVGPELAAIAGKISNDYAARGAIAPVGNDIEVGLAAKLPSCSPVDVSHRSSLSNKRRDRFKRPAKRRCERMSLRYPTNSLRL